MKFPRHKLYIDIKFLIISLFNLLLRKEKISKKYNNLKKSFEHYYNSKNIYFISTWRLGLYFILKSYNLAKSQMSAGGTILSFTINCKFSLHSS